MRRTVMIFLAAGMAAVAAPAVAQDVERYTIERTENGFVRMDTRTGRIAICEERGSQLVCRFAAEERDAYEDQLEGLQARVDALEARLSALEGGAPAPAIPSEEEFERTMGYMERFLRRFMGIVKDLDQSFRDTGPAPDRT